MRTANPALFPQITTRWFKPTPMGMTVGENFLGSHETRGYSAKFIWLIFRPIATAFSVYPIAEYFYGKSFADFLLSIPPILILAYHFNIKNVRSCEGDRLGYTKNGALYSYRKSAIKEMYTKLWACIGPEKG
jgi:hypothetical protein